VTGGALLGEPGQATRGDRVELPDNTQAGRALQDPWETGVEPCIDARLGYMSEGQGVRPRVSTDAGGVKTGLDMAVSARTAATEEASGLTACPRRIIAITESANRLATVP
jgi:hypothetical protein